MTEYIIIISVVMFCGVLLFFNTLVSAGSILVNWSGCIFCDEDAVANADAGLVDDVPVDSNQPNPSASDGFDFEDDMAVADSGGAETWTYWWDDSFMNMWDWMEWADDGLYWT